MGSAPYKVHYIREQTEITLLTACGRKALGRDGDRREQNNKLLVATDDRGQVTCKKCISGRKN